MKNELTSPPKLTKHEVLRLKKFFYLPDWQFDVIIRDKCTIISESIITWNSNGNSKIATIYGLNAIRKDTHQSCIANFFVHYESQVYQYWLIEQALDMVKLISKKNKLDQYEEKLWKMREEERRKRKVKKLKVVNVDV